MTAAPTPAAGAAAPPPVSPAPTRADGPAPTGPRRTPAAAPPAREPAPAPPVLPAPYLAAPGCTLYQGDCRDVLAALPAASVQCCVTSPPYWQMRNYGVAGQLGLEPTVGEYVANLVAVFRLVWRVLREDGTLWLNLGDAYANDAKWGGATGGKHAAGLHGATGIGRQKVSTGYPPKCLMGLPWRVAFALIDDGWVLRSDIVWAKPNPLPESVRDRPTKSHEYIFLLAKSARYWYDADAIAERSVLPAGTAGKWDGNRDFGLPGGVSRFGKPNLGGSIDGTRNRRDVWTVAPQPYAGAHFATFPPRLIAPCVLAGTSAVGHCPACGAPWRRVTARRPNPSRAANGGVDRSGGAARTGNPQTAAGLHRNGGGVYAAGADLGWQPGCRCPAALAPAPDVVLDPFAGAGTTAVVAREHGRHFVGSELSADYCALAVQRLQAVQGRLGAGGGR